MRPKAHEFSASTVRTLRDLAGDVCSNPDCAARTVGAASGGLATASVGRAAHIHAASPGGARYDASLAPEQIASVENGIWLCANCADVIDKNCGNYHPVDILRAWKTRRQQASALELGKPSVTEVGGAFSASGVGEVTGLHITRKNVKIQPGTTASASGTGKITGAKIE